MECHVHFFIIITLAMTLNEGDVYFLANTFYCSYTFENRTVHDSAEWDRITWTPRPLELLTWKKNAGRRKGVPVVRKSSGPSWFRSGFMRFTAPGMAKAMYLLWRKTVLSINIE